MSSAIAIVAAGLIIGASILFAFRWEVAPTKHNAAALRLDRWTGVVELCRAAPVASSSAAASGSPIELGCIPE